MLLKSSINRSSIIFEGFTSASFILCKSSSEKITLVISFILPLFLINSSKPHAETAKEEELKNPDSL